MSLYTIGYFIIYLFYYIVFIIYQDDWLENKITTILFTANSAMKKKTVDLSVRVFVIFRSLRMHRNSLNISSIFPHPPSRALASFLFFATEKNRPGTIVKSFSRLLHVRYVNVSLGPVLDVGGPASFFFFLSFRSFSLFLFYSTRLLLSSCQGRIRSNPSR